MSRSQQRKLKKKTHKDHRKPEDLSILEQICEWMSYTFHEESLSPDYQIVIYSNHGREWGTLPMDGPIKVINEFFKVRIGHYFKKNLYYKAQRAHQSELICQLLGNLIYNRINIDPDHLPCPPLLTHQDREIKKVFILPITVSGHKTHRLDETEMLVPTKHQFEILMLEDQDGKPIYVDLCGPQVDLCVYGTNGKPVLLLDTGKALQVKQAYSPTHKQFVKITEIGEPQEITGDKMWNDYQDNLIRKSVSVYDFSTQAKAQAKAQADNDELSSSSSSEENSYEEEKHQELMEAIEAMRDYMKEKMYPESKDSASAEK